MTARGWLAGGALHSPAHAPEDGGSGRNLRIVFENISAPAAPDDKAARLPLKRSNLAQAIIDGIAVIYLPLFASLLAASFGVAFYIALFVRAG